MIPNAPASPPAPTEGASVQAPEETQAPYDLAFQSLFDGDWKDAEQSLKANVPRIIEEARNEAKVEGYNPLLFLDQSNPIGEDHADRIYSAVCGFKEPKNVLLIVGSRGGRIEPAYLISKNCKAVAKEKFVVVVPRRAKSAATLLSLGADEIHMGSMSELGPIDPQLGRVPALSLSNALQTIAKLVTEHPGSADMFAKYLQRQLDLGMLGYFERINESATQYASRLLGSRQFGEGKTAASLAKHLVNHYKDHSFVIDKDEALDLFGSHMLKVQTSEYVFANRVDQRLRVLSRIAKVLHKKEVTFIGGVDSCLKIRDIAEDED